MRVVKTTTYIDEDCHKWAKRAVDAGLAVFGIDSEVTMRATGQWLVQKFPANIDDPCRLGTRGVYVQAPGGLTEQFLVPTPRSALEVAFTFDAEMVHEAAPLAMELDPDNPDGEEEYEATGSTGGAKE